MATVAEIQAELDSAATGNLATITRMDKSSVSTIDNFYIDAKIGAGHSRWVQTTNTDSAATQAAAILAATRT